MSATSSDYNMKPLLLRSQLDHKAQAMEKARKLYRQACCRNWFNQIQFMLGQQQGKQLLDLVNVRAHCHSLDQYHLGTQTIPLSQIRGSANEGRSRDFDAKFRPLKRHNEERWLGVATAWLCGRKLPPVMLTKVGSIYFVEDGHHRISVAQALGEEAIEAAVTEWKVAGSLPWETRPNA